MDNTSTGSPASAHDRPWLNTSLAPDERAALLLPQMTLEENHVEPETSDGTRDVQVRFTVTNTGARAGAEIAQVYLGLPASTGEPPKRLVGWAKVEVEPGETREVTVTLDPNATSRPLSYWNVTTSGWQRAGGDYQVYVGASSRDIRLTGTLHIHDAEKKDSGKQAN